MISNKNIKNVETLHYQHGITAGTVRTYNNAVYVYICVRELSIRTSA